MQIEHAGTLLFHFKLYEQEEPGRPSKKSKTTPISATAAAGKKKATAAGGKKKATSAGGKNKATAATATASTPLPGQVSVRSSPWWGVADN